MPKTVPTIVLSVCFFAIASLATAEEYNIDEYNFVWEVTRIGNVAVRLQKNPYGIDFLLSSLGGRLATVDLAPEQAAAVGNVLLKADDYSREHENYYAIQKDQNAASYRQEHADSIDVEGYRVIFHSSSRGQEFTVKVQKAKLISPVTLMTREEAMAVGELLLDAPKMAAYVNKKIDL